MIPQETRQNRFRVFPRKFPRFLAIIISILFVTICGLPASAAQFKLVQKNPDPNSQSWFYVDLMLEPEGETINAVEGKVIFPREILAAYAVSDGNSIVNLWTEPPQIGADGAVIFSGIIPGGYLDSDGLILSMVFKATQSGTANLLITQARALLNDGRGTAAKLTTNSLDLNLTAATTSSTPPFFDQSPPEDFKPVISSNPEVFNGRHFLAFATQDKGSGLDYYAVFESRQPKTKEQISASDWQPATAPYLLTDQGLGSHIYVKAVDKAGNARLVELAPVRPTFKQWLLTNKKLFAIIIVIVAIILIGSVWFVLKQQTNRHDTKRGRDKFKI